MIDGRTDIAVTDTDDVYAAHRAGASLRMKPLDMGDGGTLLIPCSVALIRGAPHPEAARKVVDFLVSAEAEAALARSGSRNIPVRASLRRDLEMTIPPASRIPPQRVAEAMTPAVQAVREILIR